MELVFAGGMLFTVFIGWLWDWAYPEESKKMDENEGTEGQCADCKEMMLCLGDRGRLLCNDCWHEDRRKEPCCFLAFDSHLDGALVYAIPAPVCYTKGEAEARATELNSGKLYHAPWRVVPGNWYSGDRIAHPGYMTNRRAALVGSMR